MLAIMVMFFTALVVSLLLIYSHHNKKTIYKIAYVGVGESFSAYNKFNRWLLQKRLDEINSKNKKIKLELFSPNKFNDSLLNTRKDQLEKNKPDSDHNLSNKKFNSDAIYAFRKEDDDQKYGLISNFYDDVLSEEKDVILVIDNTWGRHLKESFKSIKTSEIPVISLNGDRGENNDLDNNVLFLGSADNTPKIILNYVQNVLNKESVIFITEGSYDLSKVFKTVANENELNIKITDKNTCYINEKNYKQINGQIVERIECLDSSKTKSNGLAIDFIANNINTLNEKPVLVLNVHSLIGNALMRELNNNNNKKFNDLNVIGGAYIVGSNGDFSTNNTRLFLLTNPLDAVPNALHHDINQFFADNKDVNKSKIDNIPLFSERIHLASQIIDFAINNKSKLDQFPDINCKLNNNKAKQDQHPSFGCKLYNRVNEDNKKDKKEQKIISKNSELAKRAKTSKEIREIYKNTFSNIAVNKQLIVSDQVLDFDEMMRLIPHLSFEQRYKNKTISSLSQMDVDYKKIANLNFGVTNLNITSISQETKTFIAEFFVWVKSPDNLFKKNINTLTDENTQSNSNKSMSTLSDRSKKAFGSLAEVVRFDNLKAYLDTPYRIVENYNKEERVFSYVFKVKGEFYTDFKYRNFPLDKQELVIKINMLLSPEKVRVSHDRSTVEYERNKFIKLKNISGWSPKDYYYTVDRTIMDLPSDEKEMSDISNRTFQSINLRLPIDRKLLKPLILVITPILMIGLAAISVLYLRKLTFEGAGEVSVVIFLALITYSLSIKDLVPALETATKAHMLFFITFALVGLVFLYIVYRNSYFVSADSSLTEKESRKVSAFITLGYVVAVVFTLFLY